MRAWRWAALLALWPAGLAYAQVPIDALVRAYPEFLVGFDGEDLIWRDGSRMPVDDERPVQNFEAQLRNGSVLDQMRLAYPSETPPLVDAGRVRNTAFFNKMYGNCHAGEVAPHLVSVTWLPTTWGHSISITSVNGVDQHLQAVSLELDELPAADKAFLYPLGGTYTCRAVADTGQTSMHGWGAAIDINPARSDYWLWRRSRGHDAPYANHIPADIVSIFERHGFIWGGRWAHYDTMHFEYRPELLPRPLLP